VLRNRPGSIIVSGEVPASVLLDETGTFRIAGADRPQFFAVVHSVEFVPT
jgi:hypothetical protein